MLVTSSQDDAVNHKPHRNEKSDAKTKKTKANPDIFLKREERCLTSEKKREI
jgi:hypothetical protein